MEKRLTRKAAAQALGRSIASIRRLEDKGTLRPQRRKGVVVFDAAEVADLASRLPGPSALVGGPGCTLTHADVRELASLGFGDEQGIVTGRSIVAAAQKLRARIREMRAPAAVGMLAGVAAGALEAWAKKKSP